MAGNEQRNITTNRYCSTLITLFGQEMKRDASFKWDYFISHSSRDKQEVAVPLHDLLARAGKRVWLDQKQMRVGDSISNSIQQGLESSRFGILVISANFFASKWAQKELRTLVSLEGCDQNRIIPIWHRVNYEEVEAFSRVLTDRLALTTEYGLDNVAKKILELCAGTPITRKNIESFLDGILPRSNKLQKGDYGSSRMSDCEDYDDLIIDLQGYDINDVNQLEKIVRDHIHEVLEIDRWASDKFNANCEHWGFEVAPRHRRSVFYSQSELIRIVLALQFKIPGVVETLDPVSRGGLLRLPR